MSLLALTVFASDCHRRADTLMVTESQANHLQQQITTWQRLVVFSRIHIVFFPLLVIWVVIVKIYGLLVKLFHFKTRLPHYFFTDLQKFGFSFPLTQNNKEGSL